MSDTKKTIVMLSDRIQDLEAELEHWQRIALDPKVKIEASDGGVDVKVRHTMVAMVIETLVSFLEDAPNYVSMEGHSKQHGRVIITIQRGSGKSPHQLASEYRARLEALGVTDLAPLPPPKIEHQPDPVNKPHLWINAALHRFECRACGGTAPCPHEEVASRWGDLCAAFGNLHRACVPKETP